MLSNLFADIPKRLKEEQFDDLFKGETIRIERILSQGQSSPASGWYDQDENEWVMVLEGAGTLLFEDGREVTLKKGDHIHIPAHTRHRVTQTHPEKITHWMAVFY
ncbi:MAG: cupin domain-containing protein [Desulfobacterales bacterium]|nr:cupin domain-containing protein [Desulfobacterales bacterium]